MSLIANNSVSYTIGKGAIYNPTATIPPTFLPVALGTPLMAFGTRKLISVYAGACINGQNASLAFADIGFDSSNKMNPTALATNGTIACNKWYDQSGNGHDMINDGTDALPAIDTTVNFYNANAIIFGPNDQVPSWPVQNLQTAANLSVNDQSVSIYFVSNPQSNASNALFEFRKAGSAGLNCFVQAGIPGMTFHAFGPINGQFIRSQLSVNAFTSDATGSSIYSRETRFDGSALGAGTEDQLVLGSSTFGGGYNTTCQYLAVVVYPVKHTPTQAATVISALTTIFAIPTAFTSRLIYVGDSIARGTGARLNLTDQINVAGTELFNLGQPGDTMSAHAPNTNSLEGTLYTATYGAGKCKFLMEYGINDVANSTYATPALLYAAMQTWNTTILGYGSGSKTLIQTLIRSNLTPAGALDTFRTSYNTLVTANTAAFNGVADMNGIPILMSDQQSDGIHVLRGTSAPTGYVKEVPTLLAVL